MSLFCDGLLSQCNLPIDVDFNGSANQLTALAEADIMLSELTYVIFKPSGLTMAVGVQ